MAARLAASNASDQLIARLEALLHRHSSAVMSTGKKAYYQLPSDEDFHFAIAKASKSEKIERLLLSEVYYQLRILRLRSSQRPGRADQALAEHFSIVEQLKNRDPDGAERVMRMHIRAAHENSMAMLDSDS